MSTTTDRSTAPPGSEGHERRDVNVGAILRWGIGVLMLVVFAMAAVWPLLRLYEARLAEESPKASPLAVEYGPIEPPAPRLQIDPKADIAELHASEEKLLEGYAWVDRAQGRVRIPIERAMALLAERRGGGAAK